jgi:NADPH:quinone reductase
LEQEGRLVSVHHISDDYLRAVALREELIMRAIVIQQFGGVDSLVIEELPDPEPKPGHVVIEVKAFGINHAEMHMRKGEWAEAAKVSGIECVGLVKACPDGQFAVGTKVAAVMGGLGRTINGSYAEYTRALATNVLPIGTDLSWEELAVLPESYATAWTCLHRNLEIASGQTLVIRGATSALGQAALNIAADAGVRVIATSRRQERFRQLEELGAQRCEIEGPELSRRIAEQRQIDAVLDLVGNRTILDSLAMVRRGGRVCLAGFLGGLSPIRDFDPLSQMPSGVHFSFFGSFVFGKPGFPLSDVPLQSIVDRAAAGRYKAKPNRVFRFEEIREAHRAMESGQAGGKMVVVV